VDDRLREIPQSRFRDGDVSTAFAAVVRNRSEHGGVEVWEIVAAIVGLISLTAIVGAISILCSTWFARHLKHSSCRILLLRAWVAFFLRFGCPLPKIVHFSDTGIHRRSANSFSADHLADCISLIPLVIGVFAFIVSGFILSVASNVLVERAFIPSWNIVLVMFHVPTASSTI